LCFGVQACVYGKELALLTTAREGEVCNGGFRIGQGFWLGSGEDQIRNSQGSSTRRGGTGDQTTFPGQSGNSRPTTSNIECSRLNIESVDVCSCGLNKTVYENEFLSSKISGHHKLLSFVIDDAGAGNATNVNNRSNRGEISSCEDKRTSIEGNSADSGHRTSCKLESTRSFSSNNKRQSRRRRPLTIVGERRRFVLTGRYEGQWCRLRHLRGGRDNKLGVVGEGQLRLGGNDGILKDC